MATAPTIFKANLQIADLNRNYYADHLLTVAQHPSETNERMMIRMLAFALNANPRLSFGEGIGNTNDADLSDKDYSEQIALWIYVGLPDERLIRKASISAQQVIIYSYGGRPAEVWWQKNKSAVSHYSNLQVVNLIHEETLEFAKLASRGMKLNFTIQENEVMVTNGTNILTLTLHITK